MYLGGVAGIRERGASVDMGSRQTELPDPPPFGIIYASMLCYVHDVKCDSSESKKIMK